jgi:hypothetical protein
MEDRNRVRKGATARITLSLNDSFPRPGEWFPALHNTALVRRFARGDRGSPARRPIPRQWWGGSHGEIHTVSAAAAWLQWREAIPLPSGPHPRSVRGARAAPQRPPPLWPQALPHHPTWPPMAFGRPVAARGAVASPTRAPLWCRAGGGAAAASVCALGLRTGLAHWVCTIVLSHGSAPVGQRIGSAPLGRRLRPAPSVWTHSAIAAPRSRAATGAQSSSGTRRTTAARVSR